MPMPVIFHDVTLPDTERAKSIVEKSLMPLLKKMLATNVDKQNQAWNLTLINVAAVDLKRGESTMRSIASYFLNSSREIPSDGSAAAPTAHQFGAMGIDPLVWVELPEDVQREILQSQSPLTTNSPFTEKPPIGSSSDQNPQIKKRRRSGGLKDDATLTSKSPKTGPLDKYFVK
jgi:hypothetical protein